MGVEIDAIGRRVGYHPWQTSDEWFTYGGGGQKREFMPAWNPLTRQGEILHPHLIHRLGAPRGVTLLYGAVEAMDQTAQYDEAAITGAKQNAASTLLLKQTDESAESDQTNASNVDKLELSPGMAFMLRRGLEPQFWEPRNVNLAQHSEFKKDKGREIAMSTGVPYHAMCYDLEATSFSSMRGGEEQAKPFYRRWQRLLIWQVIQPMRHAWLANAILSGRLRKLDSINPGRYLRATYRGPGKPYVNPTDEARADELGVALGTRTPQQIAADRGESWTKNLEQLRDFYDYAKELGVTVGPRDSLMAELAIEDAIQKVAGGGSDGPARNGKESRLPAAVRRRLGPTEHVNGGTR
jgi:capsid protein